MKACENCGYELDDQQFENSPDGSKQARCPKCLAFVTSPGEEEAPRTESEETNPRTESESESEPATEE